MNKDTVINLRINKDLKDNFQTIVENEGFTMSQVLEAGMLDIVKRKMIPINIKSKIVRQYSPLLTIPYIKMCLEEILQRMGNNKIQSVSLFGSYSKGTATASSDVDLYLDVEDDFSMFDLAGLQIELEKSLGKKVDLVTRNDDNYFLNHIQKEKIQLYERGS